MDHRILVINKRLNAFEVRALEWTTPSIGMFSMQTELVSLWANMYSIFATLVVDPYVALFELGDESILGALLSGDEQPEPAPYKWKKHHSSRKHECTEAEEDDKDLYWNEKRAQKNYIRDQKMRECRIHEMMVAA